jgi:elongation factor 1-beta
MAQVILTFKVMPAEADTNLDNIESEIRSKLNPEKMSRQPIAFGLNAVMVTKLVEDAEGETEKVEGALRQIQGVGEVECVEVTRTI